MVALQRSANRVAGGIIPGRKPAASTLRSPTAMSDEDVKAATEATRALPDEAVRARIIELGFGGSVARYDQFVQAIREAIPVPVTVVLRGSAVTGVKWADGSPFDAEGPGTSDLDLTLVGGDMLKLFEDFYIPGLHSVPLSDDSPQAAPSLVPLRRALCRIAGRAVNIQATSSLVQYGRDILLDQPYFTLIDEEDAKAATPEDDAGRRGQ